VNGRVFPEQQPAPLSPGKHKIVIQASVKGVFQMTNPIEVEFLPGRKYRAYRERSGALYLIEDAQSREALYCDRPLNTPEKSTR
jgi:hypothetical protein